MASDCQTPHSRTDGRSADKAQLHRTKRLALEHHQAPPRVRNPDGEPVRTVALGGAEWLPSPGWLFLSNSTCLSVHEIRSHQPDKRAATARTATRTYVSTLLTHEARVRKRMLNRAYQPSPQMREEWLIPSHIPELPTDLLLRLGDARKAEALDDLERWQAWATGGWKIRSLDDRYVRSAPFKVQSCATRNDALDISQMVEETPSDRRAVAEEQTP